MLKENYFDKKIRNINIKKIYSKIIEVKNLKSNYSKSALLVLDMQNYFLNSQSNAFIPTSLEIINNINKLIAYFKDHNRPVILTQHFNKENSLMNYWWKNNRNFKGSFLDIYPKIEKDNCILLRKNYYDAFYKTKLEKLLKEFSVFQLIITGVITHICCETTARSAFIRGFLPVIPLDATADYNLNFHIASLMNLSHCCSIITKTAKIINEKI
ncbi:MAG: cysteine hydrolase [Ignavibacteria bacterium]|nr:cysteine hydrolase [Ignavibacteria bacterium]